jgi:hypothetical protein
MHWQCISETIEVIAGHTKSDIDWEKRRLG